MRAFSKEQTATEEPTLHVCRYCGSLLKWVNGHMGYVHILPGAWLACSVRSGDAKPEDAA